MELYEKIYRCKYCNREMKASGYNQNPFCQVCLPERIEKAKSEVGPGKLVPVNEKYFEWQPDEKPIPD